MTGSCLDKVENGTVVRVVERNPDGNLALVFMKSVLAPNRR